MSELQPHTSVRATLRNLSAEMNGETVVLNLENDHYYSLNPVAARIWAMVQEGAQVGEIHSTLLAEFDVSAERCLSDLLRVLGDLREMKLIEVSDD